MEGVEVVGGRELEVSIAVSGAMLDLFLLGFKERWSEVMWFLFLCALQPRTFFELFVILGKERQAFPKVHFQHIPARQTSRSTTVSLLS